MSGDPKGENRPQICIISSVVATIKCHFQAYFIVAYEMHKNNDQGQKWLKLGFRVAQNYIIPAVVSTIKCHFQAHFVVAYEMHKNIDRNSQSPKKLKNPN